MAGGAGRSRQSQHDRLLAGLRTAFDMFDKDGSGSIDIHELAQVLKSLGQYPTPVELAELMERMDTNRNGVVEWEEFSEALVGQAQDEETEQQLREVQEVFALFDADGSGALSAAEVQRALRILGVTLSADEVALLVQEIDANGDGEITCDELLNYVMELDEDEEGEGDIEAGLGAQADTGRRPGQGVRSGVPTEAPQRLPPPPPQ